MAMNDDGAVAEVEALLRRTLDRKAHPIGSSRPPLVVLPEQPKRPTPWTAAAACVVVLAGAAGLVATRSTGDSTPAAPAAAPSTTTAVAPASASATPGPDPDGPHTAYATITVAGTRNITPESLTLSGDDIDTAFRPAGRPGAAPAGPATHNRRVDGVLYVYFPQEDGSFAWTYDPDDVTTLSAHPNGHTPFELYGQVADSAAFEHVADEEIDGIAVRHVSAATPDAVDAELLRLGGNTGPVEALDLWVTDDNVVLRVEATLAGDPPTQIVVEFNDVGDPGIELAAPADAIEVDAQG